MTWSGRLAAGPLPVRYLRERATWVMRTWWSTASRPALSRRASGMLFWHSFLAHVKIWDVFALRVPFRLLSRQRNVRTVHATYVNLWYPSLCFVVISLLIANFVVNFRLWSRISWSLLSWSRISWSIFVHDREFITLLIANFVVNFCSRSRISWSFLSWSRISWSFVLFTIANFVVISLRIANFVVLNSVEIFSYWKSSRDF